LVKPFLLTKIYFSVSNDLVGDQRVHRVITSLTNAGASVTLVGRKLPGSKALNDRIYKTYRLKLLFKKGFLFYSFLNLRLFLYLIFRRRIDILVANDLDTLPANFLASRIRGTKLVYDSHEYFTEVPELLGRNGVKNFWLWIERMLLPRLKYAYTVSAPIAEIYKKKYGVDFEVIYNFPNREKKSIEYVLPFLKGKDKLLIYQGAVNIGRGLELIIDAVAGMEGVKLIIAGDGDIWKSLENKIRQEKLEYQIYLTGKIPFEQLHDLTRQADAGVSLEEDMGLNYRFAMPNKLFDYIQAGIPVLTSALPEMKKVVEKYNIGMIAESRDIESIRGMVSMLLFDDEKRTIWKKNLEQAAKDLCWENEEKKLLNLYTKAGLKIIQ
jgi:glycosyltransferase involved in cell wall biosynthesis